MSTTTAPETTYLEALREAHFEEMRRDPSVLLIGEDVATYGGAFGVTTGLRDEFGENRVLDTPISETGFTGAACGAALMGFRPIIEYQFIDFISCAFDIITNYAAPQRYRSGQSLPLVLRGPSGSGVRGARSTVRTPSRSSSTRRGSRSWRPRRRTMPRDCSRRRCGTTTR